MDISLSVKQFETRFLAQAYFAFRTTTNWLRPFLL